MPTHYSHNYERFQAKITTTVNPILKKVLLPFHCVAIRQKIVFPNKKLIVFDCGKMNRMISMLKDLKKGGHKVIIFT